MIFSNDITLDIVLALCLLSCFGETYMEEHQNLKKKQEKEQYFEQKFSDRTWVKSGRLSSFPVNLFYRIKGQIIMLNFSTVKLSKF